MIWWNSSQTIYVSYVWSCKDLEDCGSELNFYPVSNITAPDYTYYNERYEYMRNNTGAHELNRIWYQTTGLRLVIKGYNAQKKTRAMLIVLHSAMFFVFIGLLPYIFDFFLLWWLPSRKKIRDEKYLYNLLIRKFKKSKWKARL